MISRVPIVKDILVSAMLIAIGIAGLTNLDTIRQRYAQVYPASAKARHALDRCALASNAFDRRDPEERARC